MRLTVVTFSGWRYVVLYISQMTNCTFYERNFSSEKTVISEFCVVTMQPSSWRPSPRARGDPFSHFSFANLLRQMVIRTNTFLCGR